MFWLEWLFNTKIRLQPKQLEFDFRPVVEMGWCNACGWDDARLYDRLSRENYHIVSVPTKGHPKY